MTIPRTTAKKLSTDIEFRLVDESFPPTVAGLSEKGLAQRIQRARAARDKYRTLSERQNREARGRSAARGARPAASNLNTVKKQQLFEETLARYEKRASQAGDGADTSRATRMASAKNADVSARKPGIKATQGKAATKNTGSSGASKTAPAASRPGVTATKKVSAAPQKKPAVATRKSSAKETPIPSLKRVVSKVSRAVSDLKDKAMEKAAPKRSRKAPATAGASASRRTRTGAAANPKGPEFPRNAHERGRVGAAHKRQQARRDSR